MACKVCGNSKMNQEFLIREMMFGSGESFVYFECHTCKCLQIKDIPDNLADFYPPEYYSFLPVNEKLGWVSRLIRGLIRSRNRFLFFRKGAFGKIINRFYPNHRLRIIAMAGLSRQHKILDVGCGNGALIYQMKEAGFSDLLGIDPFLPEDICYQNGLDLKKKSLEDMAGAYDLVMFHHSFEHMAQPDKVLKQAGLLLKPGGVCLIRIPTTSSYAWRHYGSDWVQIDAPRHLFLHSQESIRHLADQAGLKLENVVYDSTAFQFWGSEQHALHISLYSGQSYFMNPSKSIFSKAQMKRFSAEAQRLNNVKQGDTCAFFLRKN